MGVWLLTFEREMQDFRRIDYQAAPPGIWAKAQRSQICTGYRISELAPLIVDYTGRP